jgi:trypsin-like peptidase
MALIPPFMLDCVVAIGFPDDAGNVAYVGTGFLYGRFVAVDASTGLMEYRIYLVTNRHVFESGSTMFLRFNPEGTLPAQVFDAPLADSNGKPFWVAHVDAEIDVGVIPLNVRLLKEANIQFAFFASDKHVLTHKDAANVGLAEGDGVFVLGFPMGNVGAERNYVVVRQGVIARIRDSLSGAVKQFLVDATVFPGNSGGPVVTRPELAAISGTQPVHRCSLIGLVAGYLPYRDVAISQQTQRPRIIFEENSGLSAVVPIDRVTEAIELAFTTAPPTPTAVVDPKRQPPPEPGAT